MPQHFNVPPGWPVPFGWTPPPGWEPDPSWPAAPAGWQFWVEDLPGPTQASMVTENRSADAMGKRLVILGTVGAVVLIALAGGVAMFLHGRGTTASQSGSDGQWTETSKTLPAPAPTPVVLPAGAVECGVSAGGTYRGAAKGTDSTSCPFVENVRDAFNNAGGQVPSVVHAYSPVTGKHYQMSCAMEQVITCRGGVNAVVYVYEKGTIAGAPQAADPATPGPGTNTPESVVTLPNPDVDLYIQSGIRCQIHAGPHFEPYFHTTEAACEHMFPKAPATHGPATGVLVQANGHFEWVYGNMGEPHPKVTIEPGRIYRLSGWTIVADGDDTRFTNDATGKGMVVNAHDAHPI